MKLLSWNVNGRVRGACRRQIDAVLHRSPDVLALQELTTSSHGAWHDALAEAGYSVISTLDLVGLPYPDTSKRIRRKYFNLIAARETIAALPGLDFPDPAESELAFPEKYLAAKVAVDAFEAEVHDAHLPPGASRGVVKVHAFEAIRRRVDEPTELPRILCGDFNTPQAEDEKGVTTAAVLHPGLFDRWDAAERGVLEHPVLRDVYREVHRAGDPYPASHHTRKGGRRYDHVFASPDLEVVSCEYLAAWLADRLSDHAPVEAELVLSASRSAPGAAA